jgi:hypothetical protein
VADFETMLHTVAQTVVTTPLCNMNRWADNHYALDLFGTVTWLDLTLLDLTLYLTRLRLAYNHYALDLFGTVTLDLT